MQLLASKAGMWFQAGAVVVATPGLQAESLGAALAETCQYAHQILQFPSMVRYHPWSHWLRGSIGGGKQLS